MKFTGTLDELKKIIENFGHNIRDIKDNSNLKQIKTETGATVNLYNNGTLQVQGKQTSKDELEKSLNSYLFNPDRDSQTIKVPGKNGVYKRVFVVHGHDSTSREQIELILHKLELDPFVLANTGGGGLTVIEALEKEIGIESKETCFGIVLLTPDDIGYAKSDGDGTAKPRARQNVVLEMGMLLSSIGRKNVAILKKGEVEVPSDAQGILYIPFTHHVKETVPKLVDRLRNSGFEIRAEAITKASA